LQECTKLSSAVTVKCEDNHVTNAVANVLPDEQSVAHAQQSQTEMHNCIVNSGTRNYTNSN
jgi:hypothetical protein